MGSEMCIRDSVQDGEVDLNEVVMFPFSLVMVGLLVSVRRRND